MRFKPFLATWIVVLASPAFADNTLSKQQFDELRGACEEPVPNATFFRSAAQVARARIRDLCSGAVRFSDPSQLFSDIILVAEALKSEAGNVNVPWSIEPEFDEVSLDDFAQKIIDDIRAYKDRLSGGEGGAQAVGIPSVAFTIQTIDRPANLAHGDFTVVPTSQAACDSAVQASESGQDCNAYLREFAAVYTSIKRFFASADATPTWKNLQSLDQNWTDFMNATVDQTPLELLWNGYWFRRKYGAARALVGPPGTQQILLKPYIAGDYLGEAPDGSQLNETVVLDVWGIKRWDESDVAWYKPIGVSIHTAYSDRPAVEDWGYGVSIHFTEANTIGVTSFDGEVGLFLSFDLWKNATETYEEGQKRVMEFRMRRDEFKQKLDALGQSVAGQ